MPAKHRSLLTSVLVVAALGCGDATPPDALGDLSLQVTSGNEQVGLVGQELPDPIIVRVTSQDGRSAPGILVNFVVTAGGGHVFAGSALTNADGEVKERWTLGEVPGDNLLEARSVDQTTGAAIIHAQIHATAVTAPPGTPVYHYLPPEYRSQYRLVGQTIDVRDFVFAYDATGTPIPDPRFTLTADPGLVIDGTTVRADPAAGEVTGMVRLSLAGIRDSFALGFLPDFTGHRWRASYGCRAGDVHYDIDSITNVVAVSDSVRQKSLQTSAHPTYVGLELVIYMQQPSGTTYYRDGRIVEGPLPSYLARNITAYVFPQRIAYGRVINGYHPAAGGTRYDSSGFSDGTLPPTYHGGHMCDDIFLDYIPGLLEPIE